MELSVTVVIVALTALISIRGFSKPELIERLKHSPYRETRNGEWYRLITSGFVHGGWLHLLINMFVLYVFGITVETIFIDLFGNPAAGRSIYAAMYLLTIVVGDLPTLLRQRHNPGYGSIGASGAVSGVMFIFILFFPWKTLYLYGIIPIPAILAGIGILWYSSWASKHQQDNIDHLAHFAGALFGVLFVIALKPWVASYFLQEVSNLPF